jgi:hypothetical protein
MIMIGPCPMCKTKQVELTEHHVVEAPDKSGKVHNISLCSECHLKHERYRNYLRDECGINIDKTGLS